jgi:hypothetical protein
MNDLRKPDQKKKRAFEKRASCVGLRQMARRRTQSKLPHVKRQVIKAGGACHDSTAFAQSWIGVLLREGKFPPGFYIMGDAAVHGSRV